MLLVGFRPEERQEGIAPVEPPGGGRSQEAEQGDPFGLSQEGRRFTPGLHSRGNPAKQSELDGRESRKHCKRCGQKENRAAKPNVTLGSGGGNGGFRPIHAGITSGERPRSTLPRIL
jgi:hypothetical protein